MKDERWLRIIPVAVIMYTISYVDRTNISLALDPTHSSMMSDLGMDDKMKGRAAGIFFLGYILLQIPGGYLARRWSARKVISLFLISWGVCAVGCGLAQSYGQFVVTRFLLGVAESGVFPATLVLLANWFPRSERARANGFWNLCQPLAVMLSAPLNGWLIGKYGWRAMVIGEGALPFIWLPIWWYFIRDHPRDAIWISVEEREYLETTLKRETTELEPVANVPLWQRFHAKTILVMVAIYFLHNCQAYGCMTFLTSALKGKTLSSFENGLLFAGPYAVTAVIMIIVSWHSDLKRERRGHVAAIYYLSGISLILSVLLRDHFWISYAFLCLAVPGPFAALAPFWAIPSETMPRVQMALTFGLVNAVGNVGGYYGPSITGGLKKEYGSITIPFIALGVGMLVAASLAFLLPKSRLEPVAGQAASTVTH